MLQTPHPLLWLFAVPDGQRWVVEGEQLFSNFFILTLVNNSRAFTGDRVVVVQYQSLVGIHCVEQELLDTAISQASETSIELENGLKTLVSIEREITILPPIS